MNRRDFFRWMGIGAAAAAIPVRAAPEFVEVCAELPIEAAKPDVGAGAWTMFNSFKEKLFWVGLPEEFDCEISLVKNRKPVMTQDCRLFHMEDGNSIDADDFVFVSFGPPVEVDGAVIYVAGDPMLYTDFNETLTLDKYCSLTIQNEATGLINFS